MDDVERIERIGAEIDRVLAPARLRMRSAAPASLMLYPTEHDWMNDTERAALAKLVLELPRSGEIARAARERVARKRAERLEAMNVSVHNVVIDLIVIERAIDHGDTRTREALQRVALAIEGLDTERKLSAISVEELREKLAESERENARWCARVKRLEARIDDAVDRLRGVGLPSAPEVFETAGATSEDVEQAIAFLDPNDAGAPLGPDDTARGFEIVRALGLVSAAMKARGR
jgi:hypothetical protein